jgi:acyl-CoA thioester hydrolase
MEIKPYIRKTQYYETDQMGIIHHANYIRWFEEARTDFMEQLGFTYKNAEDASVSFAVLSVSAEYKSMIRYGDTVKIYSRITAMTPARMTVAYRIEDSETGQLRTVGESGHCYMGRQGRPVNLKRTLPRLYDLFAGTLSG